MYERQAYGPTAGCASGAGSPSAVVGGGGLVGAAHGGGGAPGSRSATRPRSWLQCAARAVIGPFKPDGERGRWAPRPRSSSPRAASMRTRRCARPTSGPLARGQGPRDPVNTGEVLRAALAAGARAVRRTGAAATRRVGRRRAAERRPRADQPLLAPVAIPSGSSSTPTAQRFLDEGADFRNYTYAKYGARDPGASRRHRRPAVRRQTLGRCCVTTSTTAPGDRASRRTTSRARRGRLGIDPGGLSSGRSRDSTRRSTTGAVRPDGQGRQGRRRASTRRSPTGRSRSSRPPFDAFRGDVRDHLHLRRPAHRRRGRVLDAAGRPIPGLSPPASSSAGCSRQLPRRHRADRRGRLRSARRLRGGRIHGLTPATTGSSSAGTASRCAAGGAASGPAGPALEGGGRWPGPRG